MADQTGGATAVSHPPNRRPRVREVSSRFMSTPAPTTKSIHRRHPSETDENLIPGPYRSGLDKSSVDSSTVQRKLHQERLKQPLKENGEIKYSPQPVSVGTERIVPNRYRKLSNSVSRSSPLSSSINGCPAITAAARLLQETTSDVGKKLSWISTANLNDSDSCITNSNQGNSSCPNSPLRVPISKARCATDVRSSMPDVEKWLTDRDFEDSSKACARSINFSSFTKICGSRPPHPSSCMRSAIDSRKGKKGANHQEDVHSLKMLSNYYLQWRFTNAKAESSIEAQKQEAQIKLCTLGGKISNLRDNVKNKRIELAVLRQMKNLTTFVEAQMPYLEEWSSLEEDYSNSLSSATHALLSSSIKLPVSGKVRADVGQIEEALNSSFKVIQSIGSQMHKFTPKAEEMDILVSELARNVGGEKALVDEYWDLLSETHSLQVSECSIRAALMQLKSTAVE